MPRRGNIKSHSPPHSVWYKEKKEKTHNCVTFLNCAFLFFLQGNCFGSEQFSYVIRMDSEYILIHQLLTAAGTVFSLWTAALFWSQRLLMVRLVWSAAARTDKIGVLYFIVQFILFLATVFYQVYCKGDLFYISFTAKVICFQNRTALVSWLFVFLYAHFQNQNNFFFFCSFALHSFQCYRQNDCNSVNCCYCSDSSNFSLLECGALCCSPRGVCFSLLIKFNKGNFLFSLLLVLLWSHVELIWLIKGINCCAES